MKKALLVSVVAASSFILSGALQAGNNPNSARTLTSGIGSGTTHGRIPASHPYTSRSKGTTYSGKNRSSYAGVSLDNYRSGGYSNSPGSSSSRSSAAPSSSSSSSHGKPAAFPGSSAIAKHASSTPAVEKTAFSGGFTPSSGSSSAGIPSSASAGIPSSVSAGIPSTVANSAPSTIPPALPDHAVSGMSMASGHIPADRAASAFSGLDRRPTSVGGGRR
jgi:hypothetical protein